MLLYWWKCVVTNGCFIKSLAEGLSSGFLQKQCLRKSLPSNDNASGSCGDSCKTLNSAAAYAIF